jgi:hypothetical protein
MTIQELYDLLASDDFQRADTGNLFFPAYMYMYEPENEYEIEGAIEDIKKRLYRPSNYIDILVIDIYEEFMSYLGNAAFLKSTKLEKFKERELFKPEIADKAVKAEAYSPHFLSRLNEIIQTHLSKEGDYKASYVFVKGFGRAFPYIRASRFMNNFEKYIKNYKIIMFYPGKANDNYYSLFGTLNDENLYRAIKLINQ